MFSSKNGRAAALAAALSLVLGVTMTSCEKKPEDQGPGSPEVVAPPAAEAPPVVEDPPAAPEPVQESGPCPSAAYDRYDYGRPGATFYPLDQDYSSIFAGFNICMYRASGQYVLYNNSNEVWAMDPSIAWTFVNDPQPTSEAAFFRSLDLMRGQSQVSYVVPGETVKPSQWPDQIAWAPDPALTSGWLGQKLALENLDVGVKEGNLNEGIRDFVQKRQLKAANPVGAAIYGCVRSAQEVATDAGKATNDADLGNRLKVALGATQGTASCAGSIKELYKNPEQGEKNWLKYVEHSSGGVKQGIDASEALRPIWAACHAAVIPKIGRLSKFCP